MAERIITSEQGQGAQRWEVPDVHGPLADCELVTETKAPKTDEDGAGEDTPTSLPTAERILEIERQAYEEGLRLGREAGHAQGLEEGRQEGLARGQAEGHAQGMKAGAHKIQERLALLDGLIQGLEQPYKALDTAVEEELVQLAMAVARQLVRRELKTDPGAIVAVLRQALEALPSAERKLRLHLHPEDARLVRETLRLDELERPWSIVEDPALSRGGIRVMTDTSRVDATLESRLNAVITAAWGGERGSDSESEQAAEGRQETHPHV
ncbi:flagellar assembly protein FliH [Ectothiorhodospira magna]|uniref:Flagellar assembly protein FliH n=1 Tax=Ectothiorhodospira magna TaxID=867345 RepID=A0A1H9DY39_9GAMM|nr:flagellar assembly protein FliH [Ectothiorhodospira magna]SEQ18242.1 flagellar assembly protein FliH [Ectothiorhodospira magna]